MPVTNISSSNYPDAYTITIYKTYDLTINYSALGVSAANLRITFLWVSNEIKTYYSLNGTPYNINVTFSGTPVVNGYVAGPDLGY